MSKLTGPIDLSDKDFPDFELEFGEGFDIYSDFMGFNNQSNSDDFWPLFEADIPTNENLNKIDLPNNTISENLSILEGDEMHLVSSIAKEERVTEESFQTSPAKLSDRESQSFFNFSLLEPINLNIKKSLAQGKLIESVMLEGNQVHLRLRAEYDNPENYASIKRSFYNLYKRNVEFQAKFEMPKQSGSAPRLTLKDNHGYESNKAVLAALIGFAQERKNLNVRKALAQGRLIESVTLQGNQVHLRLQEEYSSKGYYLYINSALYSIYNCNAPFQKKFKQPKQSNSAPILTLRHGHGFKTADELLAALIGFAKSKEKSKDYKPKQHVGKHVAPSMIENVAQNQKKPIVPVWKAFMSKFSINVSGKVSSVAQKNKMRHAQQSGVKL